MIAENLHRADLTEAERRQHISEWVKITAAKLGHGDTVSERGIVEGRGNEGAILKASRDLGVGKKTVARAVAAESLPDEVKAIADAADLGTVKRAQVAKEPTVEAQKAKVQEFAEQKAKPKPPKAPPPPMEVATADTLSVALEAPTVLETPATEHGASIDQMFEVAVDDSAQRREAWKQRFWQVDILPTCLLCPAVLCRVAIFTTLHLHLAPAQGIRIMDIDITHFVLNAETWDYSAGIDHEA